MDSSQEFEKLVNDTLNNTDLIIKIKVVTLISSSI